MTPFSKSDDDLNNLVSRILRLRVAAGAAGAPSGRNASERLQRVRLLQRALLVGAAATGRVAAGGGGDRLAGIAVDERCERTRVLQRLVPNAMVTVAVGTVLQV